jgi:uncharacterized membrane protein YedE/YeeE
MSPEKKLWNPYVAGAALGLVMLFSFLVAGKGLGASGAANRIGVAAVDAVAPNHVSKNKYMAQLKSAGHHPMDDWFVFEVLGVFLGGLVGAHTAGRLRRRIIKGPRVTNYQRLAFALSGGIIMGMAARLGRGCTSGQALSGGALLSAGSFLFMFSIFAGAYALAYFVRKEWT